MPRSAITLACDFTSDTTWRAMLAAIKTNIEAMGWVQTSDTGQLNVTTSLVPTTTNQSRGYLLWKAADSLAATYPMILRLGFGSAGSATQLRINCQYGKVTDGAGNFVTTTGTPYWNRGDVDLLSSSVTAYNCYFSGDTNRLAFVLFDNAGGGFLGVALERSHDSAGADTNVGMWLYNSLGNNNNKHNFQPYVSTGNGEQGRLMGPRPTTGSLVGTSIGLFPVFPMYNTALNPSTQWLTYLSGEITGDTVFTTTQYGGTKTFLATRSQRGTEDTNLLAMRWDT